MAQDKAFDLMIGRLDRILSEMVDHGRRAKRNRANIDEINIQTLKHHAEDLILAGQKILKDIGEPAKNWESKDASLDIL